MLGDHFVRTGRLSPRMGRLVSRMQRDREDADYTSGAVFTAEEALLPRARSPKPSTSQCTTGSRNAKTR